MQHKNLPLSDAPLSSSLTLGAVSLDVSDLQAMKKFYHEIIGLTVMQESSSEATLGSSEKPVLLLRQSDLPPANPQSAGLYHMAIVFSSQSGLAQAAERVLRQTTLFAGSADHLVSEAFYLQDPEGNGIELCYDRDPSAWIWENGAVKMDALPLSPLEYIRRHLQPGKKGSMRMGHVHLKVGDIDMARAFYVDTVGFNLVSAMPSALFVSVGGYHHHLGMNVWESRGAGVRAKTLGLWNIEMSLANRQDVDALQQRLTAAGIAAMKTEGTLLLTDPWGNRLLVRA